VQRAKTGSIDPDRQGGGGSKTSSEAREQGGEPSRLERKNKDQVVIASEVV